MGWIKKLCFSAGGFILGLALLNVICVLGERIAYGAFWGEDRPKGLYQSRTGERPQLKPGAKLNGLLYQVSINSLGFRGPELQSTKPSNGLRIWCIGGSTTFDIFSSNDESTWPAQTRQHLQFRFPDLAVEEINAGIPGEVLEGNLSDFERLQPQVRADYVIIYHGPNDLRQLLSTNLFSATAASTGTKNHKLGPPDGAIRSLLNRKDIALVRVTRRLLQHQQPLDESWQDRIVTKDQWNLLRNRLEQFIRKAKQANVVPVLVSHALRAQKGDSGEIAAERVAETAQLLRLYPNVVIDTFEQYNAMLQSLAEKHRIPFADARSAVGPESRNWGDATHFRPPGSLLAAQVIADEIALHQERHR